LANVLSALAWALSILVGWPLLGVVVGFALETGDARAEAKRKLAAKGLDLVVANDALEPGAGFGVDTNRVTIISADGGEEALPLLSKAAVADHVLDRVADVLGGR
jgi:phosphopantothenoylcysteine decarboxylase/phosphopantothenate--cysteine ligase